MAEKKTSETREFFVDRGSIRDDPNVFVGINGVNYVLPKGKSSKVPVEVYEELMRSRRAQIVADEHIDRMSGAEQP